MKTAPADLRRNRATTNATAEVRAELAQLGLSAEQIETFARAYNNRNADIFRNIQSRMIELREAGLGDASLDPATGRVKVTFGDGVEIEADGIVSAIGQEFDVPKGIDANHMEFRLVIVEHAGKPRLVALDAYDKTNGNALGIRVEGAQMVKAGILLRNADKFVFDDMILKQSLDATVPTDARGVAGSIYQSNIDIPVASEKAPLLGATSKEKR